LGQSDIPYGMLHDSLISGLDRGDPPVERRHSTRMRTRAELVVRWHHDMPTAIRYRVLDISEDGARIVTSAPLIEGMTGTAVTLLPKGTRINRLCSVCWSRPPALSGAFEVGLRFG